MSGAERARDADQLTRKPATVVHLTTVHAWDDTRIYLKECRGLAQSGYQVVLVAVDAPPEARDGVRGVALPRRAGRFRRMLLAPFDAARAVRRVPADLYHLHDPELLPLGFLLRALGSRVVFDAHEDLAAQIASKPYLPPLVRPALAAAARGLRWLTGRWMSGIVAATPAIAAGYTASKTHLVQNYPVEDELAPVSGRPYTERGDRIAYVGALTAVRGTIEMVQAAGLVGHTRPCLLTLVGRFEGGLMERCRQTPGWEFVSAVGWQSRAEIATLLAGARLGLVVFHPEPNHVTAQPNKLFEYMSAGIPVVASDFPVWRELLARSDCGLVANPLDPTSIAAAITWLLDHPDRAAQMGENGRRAVSERYNWRVELGALLRCYATLLSH